MPYQLAQLNIAVARAPLDSPVMTDFVANRERINALAAAAPGFLWAYQPEAGDAHVLLQSTNPVLFHLSVWRDPDALSRFVYKGEHAEFIRRRKEWFTGLAQTHAVLWWVARNHRPTVEEAKCKLDLLLKNGPTREAFAFKRVFNP
ncbi:DUF3291 domain-containing protein [Thiomonas sp.]